MCSFRIGTSIWGERKFTPRPRNIILILQALRGSFGNFWWASPDLFYMGVPLPSGLSSQPRSQGDKMRDPENEVANPAPLSLDLHCASLMRTYKS